MAISKQKNNSSSNSSNQRPNILASCYVVDLAATLKGFHYSSTGAPGLPSPPSSPPLAALTSANELALSSRRRDKNGRSKSSRGGAAYTIREECERLFCETMKAVFLGERKTTEHGSKAMGMIAYSPPDEGGNANPYFPNSKSPGLDSWLEIWDYTSGCRFRAFVTGNGDERCLFTFFDINVVGRDLKKGLMALIELAAGPLECSQVMLCVDKMIEEEDRKSLLKSLRWVGFELASLDLWAKQPCMASERWIYLGMEL